MMRNISIMILCFTLCLLIVPILNSETIKIDPTIQEALRALEKKGYIKSPIGNNIDENVKEAIKQFQKDRKCQVTGILDIDTLDLLFHEYDALQGRMPFYSPSIGPDGTIYVGRNSLYNTIIALDPERNKKWEVKIDAEINPSLNIGPNGEVYVSTKDYRVIALNPDGSKKWELIDVNPWFTVGKDGTIFISSRKVGQFFAINPDGKVKWSRNIRLNEKALPKIGPDGTIYIGSKSNLHALNPDGSKKWDYIHWTCKNKHEGSSQFSFCDLLKFIHK